MITNLQNRLQTVNRGKHWPMLALEAVLLIVSAWRTWDFITLVMADLPGVKLYALLSVVISEGAYLVWSKFAYPNADAGKQESVTIGMIALNTIGLLLLSFGENLVRAVSGYTWAVMAANILAFTPWAMLGLNLIGALLFGVLDDDHIDSKTITAQRRLDRNAERDLKHAERMGHISAKIAAIDMLNAQSEDLARELAPHYYKDIRDRVTGQTLTNLKRRVSRIEKQEQSQTQVTTPVRSMDDYAAVSNGNGRTKAPKV